LKNNAVTTNIGVDPLDKVTRGSKIRAVRVFCGPLGGGQNCVQTAPTAWLNRRKSRAFYGGFGVVSGLFCAQKSQKNRKKSEKNDMVFEVVSLIVKELTLICPENGAGKSLSRISRTSE
jgi:hypothetical protein